MGVMLIHGDEDMCLLLREMLEEAGHVVVTEPRAGDPPIDVILTDAPDHPATDIPVVVVERPVRGLVVLTAIEQATRF